MHVCGGERERWRWRRWRRRRRRPRRRPPADLVRQHDPHRRASLVLAAGRRRRDDHPRPHGRVARHGERVGLRVSTDRRVGGGFGIHFDEVDCELDVGRTLFEFPGNAPYTIEAWALIDPNATKTFRHVFTHEDRKSNGPTQGYALAYIDTTHVRAERGITSNSFVDADSGPLAAGFHYLATTYDGGTLTLYIDGARAASSPTSDMMPSFDDVDTMIGAAPTTGQHFFGVIDDVAVYDRALGSATVAAHYQAGK